MLGDSGNEVSTPDGEWVKYKDYKAQADRIEELEANLEGRKKLMLTLAGDKINLVSELAGVKDALQEVTAALEQAEARIEELEAKLTTAIDFVAEVGGGFKFGESLVDWANLHVLKARTLLAELKGETE